MTDSSSTIVENNWRQPGLGVAHIAFTVSNTSLEPRYPTCLLQHWELANEGGRSVQRAWHGRAVVPAGGTQRYGVDVPRTPLDNRQRSDQTGFYEVSCSGALRRNRAARPSDPAPLAARAVSSDSVSLSGRRATLTFRVRITNNTGGRVRPSCYVQVAATAVSRNWYPSSIRVSRYGFRPEIRLAPRRTTTVTHRVSNVPVHVTGSKYFWVYDARCRAG